MELDVVRANEAIKVGSVLLVAVLYFEYTAVIEWIRCRADGD